jgi:redox-sensitive bicupin YhaK (pirin superfamily)
LYFFAGERIRLNGAPVDVGQGIALRADVEVDLHNSGGHAEFLLLQGRPIGEPVAHYGPFVMNTRQELEQAVADYRRTGYGGWPWPSDGPVHPREAGRFAKHADGRVEYAG